jgi:hypothetical protein
MPLPLDYEPPRAARTSEQVRQGRVAVAGVVAVFLLVNAVLVLLGSSAADGFGAAGIAMTTVPFVNVCVLLVTLGFSGRVHDRAGRPAVLPFLLAAILLLVAAIWLDPYAIRMLR